MRTGSPNSVAAHTPEITGKANFRWITGTSNTNGLFFVGSVKGVGKS
jgi:hypothetical protein